MFQSAGTVKVRHVLIHCAIKLNAVKVCTETYKNLARQNRAKNNTRRIEENVLFKEVHQEESTKAAKT